MTQAESAALNAAITRLAQAFKPTHQIFLDMMGAWLADVQGDTNGTPSISDDLTGVSVAGMLVMPAATLPSNPALNDEAIVTDATVTTDGSIVAGGGSNRVLVRWNGTNWLIV